MLPSSSPTTPPTMATYNQTYSLPSQQGPLSPMSIVDILFPGLTNISAAFQQLQTGNTNGYVRILCICGIVVFVGKYTYNFVEAFVENHFTSTVHVSHSNKAYDILATWVSRQPFAHRATSSLATVSGRRGFPDGRVDGSQKKALQYSPWNGSFLFWYKYHLLIFRSTQIENRFFPREEISVSYIGRSPKVLKDLFSECRTKYLDTVKNKTSIFEHRNGDWKKTKAVDIRQLDTVILNDERKTALLDDVKSFLESQAWYSVRGIPYRRGYPLYGPPGTGKSSLSLSIAGECDLDIYILSLSSVDDDSLGELFTELPARCVILLEDIDAVNATHSRQRGTVSTKEDATSPLAKEKPRGMVSLSALLNTIDGVGSQEGRILFMTTNHVNRLDAALIRPGRVDMKLEIGLTNRDINTRLFLAIFRLDVPDNKGKVEEETTLRKLNALDDKRIRNVLESYFNEWSCLGLFKVFGRIPSRAYSLLNRMEEETKAQALVVQLWSRGSQMVYYSGSHLQSLHAKPADIGLLEIPLDRLRHPGIKHIKVDMKDGGLAILDGRLGFTIVQGKAITIGFAVREELEHWGKMRLPNMEILKRKVAEMKSTKIGVNFDFEMGAVQ